MTYLDIIDVNSVLHSAHNVDSISTDRVCGCPNGALSVLFRKIAYLLSTDHHVICAFDSKTDRKTIIPEYKANRTKVPEVILQSELAYNLLTELNISCVKVDGFEADDLIYSLCNKYHMKIPRIYIHSSDKDLAHNITNTRVEILSVNSNSYNINYGNFVEVFAEPDFKTPLNMVTLKKVFLGDSSDNIKPFRSYKGTSGVKLFKRVLENVREYSVYDPLLNRTEEFADIMIDALELEEVDKVELKKRMKIFFPREAEHGELIEPVSIDSINVAHFGSVLRSIRCFEGLRSLRISSSAAPSTRVNEILMDYGRRFKSGEFHVDKNLSLSDELFGLDDSSVFIRDL